MRNLFGLFNDRGADEAKRISVAAVFFAVLVHILLFIFIRFNPVKVLTPGPIKPPVNPPVIKFPPKNKPIEKIEPIGEYKPKDRSVPIAVPDPRFETELPALPENSVSQDEISSRPSPGAIIPPMIVKKYIPEYPETARLMGLEGEVKIICTLDSKGNPVKVRISNSSGAPVLDQCALNAAKTCIFTPALQGDIPMGDIDIEITYKFLLEGIDLE